METQMIRVKNGHTLALNCYGTGTEVFVLLHGIPGSSRSWDRTAKILADSGARVFVPDLLGFGQSSKPMGINELWLESQARAVAEGLDKLGVHKFHLVGHDYGGPISVTLCDLLYDRIKSLSLLATNMFTDTPIPPPLALIKVPFFGHFWSKFIFSRMSLKMMLKYGVGNARAQIDTHSALGNSEQIETIALIFDSALRELGSRYRSVEDSLSKIKIPTKVFWGTKDPFFNLEQGQRTANTIQDAKLVILEGAGHFLPEERPDEIANELKLSGNLK